MPIATTVVDIVFRVPSLEDGASVHQLIEQSPPLELNSCYTYLLLSSHFAGTCAIAELDGKVVGFLGAYRPPSNPDALFVWQVAVSEAARGQRLGRRMMEAVLNRPECDGVRWLEASVTPNNEASQRLFRGAARAWSTDCQVSPWLEPHHFGARQHEAEELFRIGPITRPLQ